MIVDCASEAGSWWSGQRSFVDYTVFHQVLIVRLKSASGHSIKRHCSVHPSHDDFSIAQCTRALVRSQESSTVWRAIQPDPSVSEQKLLRKAKESREANAQAPVTMHRTSTEVAVLPREPKSRRSCMSLSHSCEVFVRIVFRGLLLVLAEQSGMQLHQEVLNRCGCQTTFQS